ncbi:MULTISPECIES: site-specific integrase [unclassified Caballeronia]|uniref:site-specific integrase n=1 Tax=unclassified Caballeronia TaxID=2646786 RepID=UPI0028615E3D|nr:MULTISPECIES: site-specific integrase [unclassified Caballeronia]MDR5777700.1 site-specific integrase [Caballeronia sp. LZ002]MDR5798856.1 site-specific integrase [Caballeronia sp. LZ001]MDR5853141.1 site-specific integrase [Caballeronia sp. LZ003]
MKTRLRSSVSAAVSPADTALPDQLDLPEFPTADELAALRAWSAGLASREAVQRFLPNELAKSARGVIGRIRRQLVDRADQIKRADLADVLRHPVASREQHAQAVSQAIEVLRHARPPLPDIADPVERWFSPRTVRALHAYDILTLADLTVRIPRRRQWWTVIPDLGAASAKAIEAFFAAHPSLTERARALILSEPRGIVVPWESLKLPHQVDGSEGTFRAPVATCTLDAGNDYDAIHAWLSLHESPATRRTYRKEAERLILWAIVERGRALSSLTTEDAVAYRAFLRRPTPHARWVGPLRPRHSPDWRPFAGALSARSAAHAISILNALFRWLIDEHYVLANPFSGIKVRGGTAAAALDASRAFTDGEWQLIRTIADGLEYAYGWSAPAAHRLRFLLDFGVATGLRAGELVGTTLRQIETDPTGLYWLRVTGKGHRIGKVALPPLAWNALTTYLLARQLPVSRERWKLNTPLIGNLDSDTNRAISGVRLWAVMKRFFKQVAQALEVDHPPLADKLRAATPHWMRHSHASLALSNGAELTTVRDNLRHASIATTSIYLHSDDVKRARQLNDVFGARYSGE